MKWVAVGLVALVACNSEADGEGLSVDDRCKEDADCGAEGSCRAGTCVTDESLGLGETCTQERQCGVGLLCHSFICKNGCTDIYFIDDCAEGLWCKPLADAFVQISETERIPVGQCAASECDPETTEWCVNGDACVAITTTVGACVPYCEYGHQSSEYRDTCTDTFEANFACAPLGIKNVPVCLPSNPIDPPPIGVPGCDTVRDPCGPGNICVDVVCRKLCSNGQANACPGGQRCAPHGLRNDLFYCRAD